MLRVSRVGSAMTQPELARLGAMGHTLHLREGARQADQQEWHNLAQRKQRSGSSATISTAIPGVSCDDIDNRTPVCGSTRPSDRMRQTVKEGEEMNWSEALATTRRALGTILEVHLVNPMARWDMRVVLGTPPEAQHDGDGEPESPLSAILGRLGARVSGGIPMMGWGGGTCDQCGEVHAEEVMILIPLPDDTFLVSHKERTVDGVECNWADHAADQEQAQSAARFHEEFQCARRHANK